MVPTANVFRISTDSGIYCPHPHFSPQVCVILCWTDQGILAYGLVVAQKGNRIQFSFSYQQYLCRSGNSFYKSQSSTTKWILFSLLNSANVNYQYKNTFTIDLHFRNRQHLFPFLHIRVKKKILSKKQIFFLFFSKKVDSQWQKRLISIFTALQDPAMTSKTKTNPPPV